MSETQEVFSLTELESICFRCPTCGTEIVFRLDGDAEARVERQCPECYKNIPGAAYLLLAYRKIYADAKRLGTTVELRGPRTALEHKPA